MLSKNNLIYHIWSIFRQSRQSSSFLDLIESNFTEKKEIYDVSSKNIQRTLYSKNNYRSKISQKPNILAVGANDWEKYGLWPSLNELTTMNFIDYQKVLGVTHEHIPSDETRTNLKNYIMSWIDQKNYNPEIVFFYLSGSYISNNLLEKLNKRKIWTVVLSLDDKQQFFQSSHQLRVASKCDIYLTTWKTGTHIIKSRNGNPWYIPPGSDPKYFYAEERIRDKDVTFVGGAYGLRYSLINTLMKRNIKVHAFGAGWHNGYVDHDEMINLFNQSKIVLGIGSVGYMNGVKHLKGRDFEVPMCGALYLTSFNPELADHFIIGKEILCYSSIEECIDLIHWVLNSPEEAQKIRDASLKRSLSCHTWSKRFSDLFAFFP